MIKSYKDKKSRMIMMDIRVKKYSNELCRLIRRKLKMMDAAVELSDLRVPPGNRLEALSQNRKGQHSIRVNDQWRICFRWVNGHCYDVEVTDYH